MQRPFWKQFWFWAIIVLVLVAIFASSPLRIEYHKWRLQSTKDRKARLLGATPSGVDKFWLNVTGNPASGSQLDGAIRKHEDALVKLGFLHREAFVVESVSAGAQFREASDAIQSK